MQQIPDAAPGWLAQAGALIGVGGLGAILLKLIERLFARADTQDQLAIGLRAEMIRRLEVLEAQQRTLEASEREKYREVVELRAENRQLRRRYHDLVNWIGTQPGLPTPPRWLYEPVDGPTSGSAMPPMPPLPPSQERPS